jgi:hypothetical protein
LKHVEIARLAGVYRDKTRFPRLTAGVRAIAGNNEVYPVQPLRADRPFKKKTIQLEAADVVAEARAAESIGISFQNPLALAVGRFSAVSPW